MQCHPILVRFAGPGLLVCGLITNLAAATPLRSGILEYEIRTTRRNAAPVKEGLQIWFRDQSYRTERTLGIRRQIVLNGPDGCFQIDPRRGEARRFRARGIVGTDKLPALVRAPSAGEKRAGSARIGGFLTDRFVLANAGFLPVASRQRWLSRENPRLIVKEVVAGRVPGEQTVTLLKSARLNVPVPDGQFRLPRGLKLLSAPPARKSPTVTKPRSSAPPARRPPGR